MIARCCAARAQPVQVDRGWREGGGTGLAATTHQAELAWAVAGIVIRQRMIAVPAIRIAEAGWVIFELT